MIRCGQHQFSEFSDSGLPEGQSTDNSENSDNLERIQKIDLERIDKTLRLLMDKEDVPFGGKIILLSGDFRQISKKFHL